MKTFINYILSILLSIFIIILFFVILISKTVLKEEYVLQKLDEHNYYSNIYKQAMNNFENYIHQSGFDETVLENVLTEQKIKEDTTLIIDSIYTEKNNENEIENEIDTEDLKNNLRNNIEKTVGKDISKTQEKSIDSFIERICNEYKTTISYYKTEANISKYINKLSDILNLLKIILLVIIGIDFILLFVINLKRFYEFFKYIGISNLTSGLLLTFIKIYTCIKTNINAITILNDTTSEVLRDILNSLLFKILVFGIAFIIFGIALIIISELIKNKSKEKIKE